ncbi:MAG TPA: CPBP family glutamic-type intramembrane protease [Puia sp.]|uniref:CPBP family glutamic-type intramembrane protease n=1 Tax=Puia sp. TaxID=2045100 RepID=UPI002CDD4FDA|nr:CPBP family glutamic-type intramembrane protease [Puia sp.]HVU95586.1 CPBP family glutamic-type intramembrane protease [Puia sp.]
MRAFINYLTAYLRSTSRPALFITLLFVAALVAANYTVGIESRIRALPWYLALGAFFLFYLVVLALVWGLQYEWNKTNLKQPKLLILLGLAPLYFALKMVHWDILPLLPAAIKFPWDRYTQLVLQLPLKLLLLFAILRTLYTAGLLPGNSFASAVGLTRANFNALPYFGLLLCTVPLIVLASTQHDFLLVYPKVKNLSFINGYAKPEWPWKLLYEVSYGLDFLGIELFFRGLLVVVLVNYVGQDAILPMAAFYCTIHFGKPLGECISSFFGGLILGVLAARTRTILGGLIVHLGLAWFMELGGWLGGLWHH